jgi:RecB family exonuclease
VRIPVPPTVVPIARLSPSQYEAGRACKARLAWAAAGRRNELPEHPKALLGTCFHSVVEAAATGRLTSETEEQTGVAARDMFDQAASVAYARAHPLVRVKYQSIESLPHYYLFRERAALMARRVAQSRRSPSSTPAPASQAPTSRALVETTLTSLDGLLFGRPDYVDVQASEILDYKTGASADDAGAMSPSEGRQIRLYVHLALENGLSVSRGVIVRPGGRRAETEVTKSQADGEGRQARELLEQFNQAAGRSFEGVADPSAETCKFCSCIPFCEAFWRAAAPSWLDDCGTHIEGRISGITESRIQGIPVLTLDLEITRGTVDGASGFVEQLPESWITIGGQARPAVGEVLRVVHGRTVSPGAPPVVIRVDRALTSVWTVPKTRASMSAIDSSG